MNTSFELVVLGSNSAMPAYGRYPTSQVLSLGKDSFLIDCGEGAQLRMIEYKIKRNNINYVLISHLHGDHLYGLPGFLGSLSHLSRKKPLTVYGPIGIKEYLETVLRLSQSHRSYELIIHELEHTAHTTLVDNKHWTLSAFPVNHRLPTYGYLIREKPAPRNIDKAAISEYALTVKEILAIKGGADLNRGELQVFNAQLTLPASAPRSYAYCADTQVKGWDKQHLKGVELLYFETTYLHDKVEQAEARGHATTVQAAQVAMELEVGQLLIGHYSSRYKDVDPLLAEAQAIFPATIKGYDGVIINL